MPRRYRNTRKEVRKLARKEKKQLKHRGYLQKRKPKNLKLLKDKLPSKVIKNRNIVNKNELGKVDTGDDQEIRELEKRLKLKGKQSLPSNFYDEGLGFILDYKADLGEERAGWGQSSDASVSEEDMSSVSEVDSKVSSENGEEQVINPTTRADVEQDSSEESEPTIPSRPPACTEPDIALTKRITGLINRLSKCNINQTVNQIIQLYQENSAHDMNEAVSLVVQRACIQDVLLLERLTIECMLVLTITQGKLVTGSQLGIHFIIKIVKKFDSCFNKHDDMNDPGDKIPSKVLHNTVRCLSYLYCFKVISSVLIYDVVRKLASRCHTLDIELLLIILKTVGLDIRREDPHSMKDIIMEIQGRKKSIEDSRVDWMLDTINAIKTNNHRKIPNYDPSRLEEYIKLLRAAKLTEETQLNLRYEEIVKVDESGNSRFLLSMYKERKIDVKKSERISNESAKFAKLMQQQRMNTDIRRKIFTVLMTSSDYLEATQNLSKLDLTKVQRREIPKIVVECCIQEDPFNPYYAYLSQQLCNSARGEQITYQYTLWDKIKNLREMSNIQTSNLIQLMLHLVQTKSLSICVLKVINFTEIDKPTIKFLRKFLALILFELHEEKIVGIFQGLRGKEHLQSFRYSLSLFLKHLMKNDEPSRVRRVALVQDAMGMSYLIKI